MGATSRLLNWFGGTPAGVWTIKHLVSPLDRRLYGRTGGRLVTPGHPHGPIVLLTTIGRRTATRTRPRSSTSRMGSGSSCAMSPRAASGPTPGRSTCAPIPWPGSSSAPRSEPTGPGRPPRPSSSGIGPSSCGSGPRTSAFTSRGADDRCSCSTPPPRSNPNRRNRSPPEPCRPRPASWVIPPCRPGAALPARQSLTFLWRRWLWQPPRSVVSGARSAWWDAQASCRTGIG
jgi:hypothetical protein